MYDFILVERRLTRYPNQNINDAGRKLKFHINQCKEDIDATRLLKNTAKMNDSCTDKFIVTPQDYDRQRRRVRRGGYKVTDIPKDRIRWHFLLKQSIDATNVLLLAY